MSRILHRIKYKFSEPYRIRVGRGLNPLRSKRERDAVIAFCRDQLKDEKHMKLNPDRKRVYEMTVKLHEQEYYNKLYDSDLPSCIEYVWEPVPIPEWYHDVDEFIDDHVGWYWS